MFEVKLPQQINPLRLGQQAVTLCGHVPLDGMTRLAELVHSMDKWVEVKLDFMLNESNKPIAKGFIQLSISLICQRCLKPLIFDLKGDINWAFVATDAEAKQIQGSYDPILIENEKVDLFAQIEDEILLNLPLIALHEDALICGSDLKLGLKLSVAPSEDTSELEKSNPFAELAKLKVVKKSKD